MTFDVLVECSAKMLETVSRLSATAAYMARGLAWEVRASYFPVPDPLPDSSMAASPLVWQQHMRACSMAIENLWELYL